MAVISVLTGHVSPETAFVVDDYPYGFRLRCKIRYWIEYRKSYGFRMMSQTTNPKKAGEIWNKPKGSTYVHVGAALYLDEEDHVQWMGVGYWTEKEKLDEFRRLFAEAIEADSNLKAQVESYYKVLTAREGQLVNKIVSEGSNG